MASIVYGLVLEVKGDVKRVKLKQSSDKTPLTQAILQKCMKKKTDCTQLGTYLYGQLTLTLFGYTTGKAGTENKHELPPPYDSTLYFGDILLIASKHPLVWEHPVSFSPEQYELFYQKAFGGFEDIDEDEEEDEDHEEQEQEDQELEHVPSEKKKVAEELGVPEDEGNEDEEEEEDDEDEDDEDEEEEDEEEVLDHIAEEEEEVRIPVKQKAPSKKKPAKANLTVAQNTGRAKQQTMFMQAGLQQIETLEPIPTSSNKESQFRNHVLQQSKRLLGTLFTEEQHHEIEQAILKNALSDADTKYVMKHFDNSLFQVCYMNSARKILSNLDSTSYVKNTQLLSKLLQKDLEIEHLATMTCMDYAPTLYTGMRDRMLLREQQQLEGNKAMATDMFKCGRCHKREATFYELQTRSADEPMTKFITCVNCGNHWKQ